MLPTHIAKSILPKREIANRKEKVKYIRVGCGYDIETTKILDDEGEIIGSYCYHWQFSCGENYVVGRKLEDMQTFFAALIETIRQRGDNIRLLIWVANLGYEWQFCKKYFYYLDIDKFFCKEIRDPLRFILGGCLEFRECLGLFGHSLQDIAKKYTECSKMIGDLDYNEKILSGTVMKPKEINYCIVDVKILAKLGDYVFDHYFGRNAALPLTATGLIRNKIKNRIGKKLKSVMRMTQMYLPDENDFYFLRRWGFKGGICGTNIEYMCDLLEGVICADLTSDYPAQMLHEKFPSGFCMKCDPSKFMSEDRPYIAHIRFHNLKSTTSHALFSSSKAYNCDQLDGYNSIIDNGRIVYAQEVEFVLTDVEMIGFNKAYDYDEDVEIISCWQFDEYAPLPEYVTSVIKEQYKMKNKLSREGKKDTQEYKDAKAFVNGIFGMFATSLFPFEKKLSGEPDCIVKPSENKTPFKKVTEKLFLNPFWAFWVTSYARNILIDVITRFPDAIIQYDTDSVYYKKEYAEEVTEYLKKYNVEIESLNETTIPDSDFSTLGHWEIDPPTLKFKGLGAKRYCYQKQNGDLQVTVCGCRKGSIEKMIKIKTAYKYCRDMGLHPENMTDLDLIGIYDEKFGADHLADELFKTFDNGMFIPDNLSGKMASFYVDDELEMNYTDRDGNTEHIKIPSCMILKSVPFSMKLHKLHLQLANEYKSFESLAKNSRVLEIMEKRKIRWLHPGMEVDHDPNKKKRRKKEN